MTGKTQVTAGRRVSCFGDLEGYVRGKRRLKEQGGEMRQKDQSSEDGTSRRKEDI